MKFARCLSFLALLSSVAAFVHADDALPPEQRITAIEQKFLSGDRRGARQDVKIWRKADEKAPEPWLAAANLSFHQKKYRRCLSQAATALERAPQNADAYFWRGRCYEANGKTLDAANEYRAALKAEAAHPQAQEGLARIESTVDGANPLPTAN